MPSSASAQGVALPKSSGPAGRRPRPDNSVDSFRSGFEAFIKLWTVGVINAAVEPWKRQVEALQQENEALAKALEEAQTREALLRRAWLDND